jgi:hypothetical protein
MSESKTPSGQILASGSHRDLAALSEAQLELCFDQAAAELRWINAQEILAVGPDIVENDDAVGGGTPKPLFGSEQWLRVFLVSRLCRLKIGLDQIDEDHSKAGTQSHGPDYDKYVHLNIPRRHRKFHRLLAELLVTHPWIKDVIDPEQEDKASLAVVALRSMGVDATCTVRYRDLGEERTFP